VVVKMIMEAIEFTMTLWPILSNYKNLLVDKALKLSIDAQDRQRALGDAPDVTPSVCQLPVDPSLQTDLETQDAISLEFC